MCRSVHDINPDSPLPPGSCQQHGPPGPLRDERWPECYVGDGFPDLEARQLEWIEQHRSERNDPHENHASQLGHPCERHIYLSRTGAERKPIDDGLAAIFQLGDDWEDLAAQWYRRLGFRRIRSQEHFRVVDPVTGEVLWVGNTDGVLEDRETGARFAVDDKTSRDPRNLRPDLRAKYIDQLQLYMGPDALDQERGMVVLWDKQTGKSPIIKVTRDPERYSLLMDKARRLNEAVRTETPPDFVSDLSICDHCPFRERSCHPAVKVDAIGLIDHPEIETMLWEALTLEDAGKRHKKLAEALKAAFKGNADGTYLTSDGITVTVKTNKAGATTVKWSAPEKEQETDE